MRFDRTILGYFGLAALIWIAPFAMGYRLLAIQSDIRGHSRIVDASLIRQGELSERSKQLNLQKRQVSAPFQLPYAKDAIKTEAQENLQNYVTKKAETAGVALSIFSAAPIDEINGFQRIAVRFEGQSELEAFYTLVNEILSSLDMGVGLSELSIRRNQRIQKDIEISFQFVVWQYFEEAI